MMDSTTEDADIINGQLYNALIKKDDGKVMGLCRQLDDRALHMLTIHDDTLLHMAIFSKRRDLSLKLLDELPQNLLDKMTLENKIGNTILHEAATSNRALAIADKVLKKAPGLLGLRNKNGETPLFRAASYGKTEMFNFLADKICDYDQARQKTFLKRNDKTTVLHISILCQHYGSDLALHIAKKYRYLVDEKDGDDLTSLQILSCNPSSFKHEIEDGLHMQLINSIKLYFRATWGKEVQKEKQRYKSALELAKFLIEKDTSWKLCKFKVEDRNKPKIHKYGFSSDASSSERSGGGQSTHRVGRKVKEAQTPLILATKSGYVEIVEEILKLYPQAIEYIDDDGQNILHLAIKYRQLEIFNLLTNMEVAKRRLIPRIDKNGNTTLHMVCKKRKDYVPGKMRRPALVLQEELLWFERVKKVMPRHFLEHQNNMIQTADGLFADTYRDLYNSATEWLKITSEKCSVVAVLIATVTYAAAYTIPGGPNQNTGVPILISQPLFVVFTLANTLSLIFAMTSVVSFLSILASSFRFKDFTHVLPNRLMRGFRLLFLSFVMMMVAFTATLLLMICRKESWTKMMVYNLSFIPIAIVAVAFYLPSSETCKNLLRRMIRQAITWSQHFLKLNLSKNSNLYKRRGTEIRSSTIP